MRTRNYLSLVLAGSLLFTLVSCGNDNKSSKASPQIEPLMDDSANWKILLQGRSFPDNSRVDINGVTVINECKTKQKYSIDRTTEPQSILLENYFVPKEGEVKINVADLGNCDSSTTFISNDNVDFDMVKGATALEVHINL